MQHTIPVEQLGQHGQSMTQAIESCVHCGFCLPTCPTYVTLGEEMDSPRGRIFLMKSVLEGNLKQEAALPFIDRCLGCQACVTACPSGVRYGELITPFRARAETSRKRSLFGLLTKELIRQTLPYPNRFRLAVLLGQLAQPLRGWLPEFLKAMLALLPNEIARENRLPGASQAIGKRRSKVALLAGCVQQVIQPNINMATIRVLQRNGVEVVVPEGQGCCGALLLHTGDVMKARALARRNLETLSGDFDAVLSNAAGCGSSMKEYGWLFEGDPDSGKAQALAEKVRDVSEFLDQLGLDPLPDTCPPIRVAYHDACHLAHAQHIQTAPRRLIGQIPNISLLDLPESELCCGSAGTYNIEQPALAAQLGKRKVQNILSTGAEVVVMGNVGCMIQISKYLEGAPNAPQVLHTIELLDRAYSGTLRGASQGAAA
jgi:glycolate oxidase iron-sulfur subunit